MLSSLFLFLLVFRLLLLLVDDDECCAKKSAALAFILQNVNAAKNGWVIKKSSTNSKFMECNNVGDEVMNVVDSLDCSFHSLEVDDLLTIDHLPC